ncbi:MAG: UbiA family prenyltransferase [Verrucomicrobia bacterium]|nr:UbiA family prenyltransferase [Verrucomicrobiota bacterium]
MTDTPKLELSRYLRTLLVLGRVSNLPTVWSNCLAGWLLGGGGNWNLFALLCLSATCLYTGGMFLNDAFDARFDRRYRSERPIPAGAISEAEVWHLSYLWLGVGMFILIVTNQTAASLGVVLLACVVLYDAVHKFVAWSPLLMALCRFFLYLVAAATGDRGVTGLAIWSAFALAFYIVGLSYLARRESTGGLLNYWPFACLAAPVALAFIVNGGESQFNARLLSALLVLWCARSLGPALWKEPRDIGASVAGLLAGIVLVDLLSVADVPPQTGAAFLVLFGAALVFQRFVPAT